MLDGSRIDKPGFRTLAVALAVIYFARRMLLCVSLVLYPTFLWGQIAVQFFVATIAIIVL